VLDLFFNFLPTSSDLPPIHMLPGTSNVSGCHLKAYRVFFGGGAFHGPRTVWALKIFEMDNLHLVYHAIRYQSI